jgi:hypothetical protein
MPERGFGRCRAGALRGPRPLRGGYTGFALGLPLVGAKIPLATNGSLDPKGITNHEVIAAGALAMTSISTRASLGRAATATVERAGGTTPSGARYFA